MHENVTVDKLSSEGRGLAHIDRPCFITGALPGEDLTVKILKKYKGIFEAVAASYPQNASEMRVEPKCPHFLQCGGCSLQHINYAEQVAFKFQMFKDLWSSYNFMEPKWQAAITDANLAYRRKARISLRFVEKKNKLLLGFKELDARKILDMHSCKILTTGITDYLFDLQEVLADVPEKTHIPQIELVEANEGVAIVLRHLVDLSPHTLNILKSFSEKSRWHFWLQRGGPDTLVPLNGSGGFLHYDLPEFNLCLAFGPLDFIQVNSGINQKLVSLVIKWLSLSSSDVVLDLFCGLGNFSLPIAQRCAQVIGIEGSDEMVLRAATNASTAGLSGKTKFFQHDLRTSADRESWFNLDFNKVLLDPPRSGAKFCCEWLLQKRPKQIVYVSCNPKSMMNDLKVFFQGGYKVCFVTIADMFPHTAHTEAIATLELEG